MMLKYFRYLILAAFVAVLIPILATRRASANVDETYHFYLPLVLNGPHPQPFIERVSLGGVEDISIEISPGESFILRVEASNRDLTMGGSSGSGIFIGFPDLGDETLVTVSGHDLDEYELTWDGYYQIQALDEPWQPGDHRYIEMEIGPLRAQGDFRIYVKSVMTMVGLGAPMRYVSPLDGKPSATDTDGELSQLYTVNVQYVGPGIGRLNYYRDLAGVPLVRDLSYWSQGCAAHAYYMVMNGWLMHDEDTENPYYSYEGYAAAQSSNLVGFDITGLGQQDGWPVDVMMQSAFHAIPLLDPRLTLAGYGQSNHQGGSLPFAAVLDVYRGVDYSVTPTYPIYWPPEDGVTPLVEYTGGEIPDPLTHCGYTAPSGAPVFLILGDGTGEQTLSAHSLKQDGVDIPHCAFDYKNYTNPTPTRQRGGRDVLDYYDTVVIIPLDPLVQGSIYTASMTAGGQTYSWNFHISPGFVDAAVGQVLVPQGDIR